MHSCGLPNDVTEREALIGFRPSPPFVRRFSALGPSAILAGVPVASREQMFIFVNHPLDLWPVGKLRVD